MIYTVIDIETTGLLYDKNTHKRLNNDIIQFSYVRLNDNFEVINHGTLHFYYEGMSWSDEAEKIHHISLEYLKQFKDDFEKNLQIMYTIMCKANVVGFNSDKFDIPFIEYWLARFKLPIDPPCFKFDVMLIYRSIMPGRHGWGPSLLKVCDFLGYTPDVIKLVEADWFGADEGTYKHNASYDVTATGLAFINAARSGYTQGIIAAQSTHTIDDSIYSGGDANEHKAMSAEMFGTPVRVQDGETVFITNISGTLPFRLDVAAVNTDTIEGYVINREMTNKLIQCANDTSYTYIKGEDGRFTYTLYPGCLCVLNFSEKGNTLTTEG